MELPGVYIGAYAVCCSIMYIPVPGLVTEQVVKRCSETNAVFGAVKFKAQIVLPKRLPGFGKQST